MSIPLDRLYHYIESVAQDVYGDTLIYHFYPYGSKKITDLLLLSQEMSKDLIKYFTSPQIICNDQEPLNFEFYQNCIPDLFDHGITNDCPLPLLTCNLRKEITNVFDQCIILHSEQRSHNVDLYQKNGFIPTYYWNHAFLALDWYRYAEHINKQHNNNNTTFLIYNRAWSGTREYRLKFAEMLINSNLVDYCRTSIGFTNNEVHYTDHEFQSSQWRPNVTLENYFSNNNTTPCYSADFSTNDYNQTQIEIVLETLFDDDRWHLTEKTLRPIALGQPFLLCATAGSLQYLRNYGFKTFNTVFNEDYDQIQDPMERLKCVINTMKDIVSWPATDRTQKYKELYKISQYNKKRFFSQEFLTQIKNELHINLKNSLNQVENLNTGQRYLELSKYIRSISPANRLALPLVDRIIQAKTLKIARQYKYSKKHQ